MVIIEDFREWRETEGYTITSLAEALNVGYTAVWRYEYGKRRPEDDVLIKLEELSKGKINWRTFRNPKPSEVF